VMVGASQLLDRDGMSPADMVQAMLDYYGTTTAGLQAMIDAGWWRGACKPATPSPNNSRAALG